MEKFVTIINPANGRKGRVAASSKAAAVYNTPPSERTPVPEGPPAEVPVNLLPPLEMPGKNGSTEEWRTYATDSRNPQALSSDTADQMTRDDLVAYFDKSEED